MPPKTKKPCMEGYCVKCKKMQPMLDCKPAVASNGRKMMKGVCKVCGAKMNKFI